jgi:uncharacterized RDD family membrane protein YckC
MENHEQATHDDATVLAIDNVPLELPVAGIGNRVLAAFIDHFLLAIVAATLGIAAVALAMAFPDLAGWAFALWALVAMAVNWAYFAILEIALSGQTPGKMALSLRVVSQDGGSASRGALIIRNLMRTIDNLIGILFIAIDQRARRIGDRLAGTVVIHEQADSEELVLGRLPAGWGARHIAVVEAFCERCPTLQPEEAGHLARRILALIARDDPQLATEIDETRQPVDNVFRVLRVGWL